MKKILLSTMIVLLLTTGCGKVPKLENGQEAVVTLEEGDISVDALYEELKDKYALNILINMVDTQILEKLYPSDDEEKSNIKNQIETIKYYYENYYKEQFSSWEEYLTQNGVANENAICAEIKATEFSAFDLKITGFEDSQKETKLALGAYVAVSKGENTEYSYMQDSTKGTTNGKYYFASYNDITGKSLAN